MLLIQYTHIAPSGFVNFSEASQSAPTHTRPPAFLSTMSSPVSQHLPSHQDPNGKLDKIFIQDLHVRAILGVRPWEREKLQDIVVNITVFTDSRNAAVTDDIAHCVDYSLLAKRTTQRVQDAKRWTVESLADDIAQIALEDRAAIKVIVRVEKPGAVRFSKSVGIEIERSRDDFLNDF